MNFLCLYWYTHSSSLSPKTHWITFPSTTHCTIDLSRPTKWGQHSTVTVVTEWGGMETMGGVKWRQAWSCTSHDNKHITAAYIHVYNAHVRTYVWCSIGAKIWFHFSTVRYAHIAASTHVDMRIHVCVAVYTIIITPSMSSMSPSDSEPFLTACISSTVTEVLVWLVRVSVSGEEVPKGISPYCRLAQSTLTCGA